MNRLQQHPMLCSVKGQKGHRWGVEIAIFVGIFFALQLLVSVPVTAGQVIWMLPMMLSGEMPDLNTLLTEQPDWLVVLQLFSTAIMSAGILLFCRFVQKRKPASLGLTRRNAWREYGIGALIGLLLFALCVGIAVLFGGIRLSVNASWSVGMWILFFFGFLIQGMSEELLCRGYFMISLSRRCPLWAAVLINSVMFSLLHIFNNGITIVALINIALFGILMSVYVLLRGDLWGACAMHSLWNFAQGNLFGVPVSGMVTGPSPFLSTLTSSSELITGGSFGIEASLITTAVLLLGIGAVCLLRPWGVAPSPTFESFKNFQRTL